MTRAQHRQTQAQGELEDEAEEVPRPTPADEAPPPENPDKPLEPTPPPDHTLPEQGPDVPPGEPDLHAAVQALTRAVGYLAGHAPPFVRQAVDEAERALTGLG